jgi:hypothetical protein
VDCLAEIGTTSEPGCMNSTGKGLVADGRLIIGDDVQGQFVPGDQLMRGINPGLNQLSFFGVVLNIYQRER